MKYHVLRLLARVKHLLLVNSLFLAFLVGQAQSASDMLENILPSVVTVAVYKRDADSARKLMGFNTRGPDPDQAYQKILQMYDNLGSGSGFIIERNKKKYVITNAHVVEYAAALTGSIYIYSITQQKYEMQIMGGDSFYDVAVLEFLDAPGPELKTIEFEERSARIGEVVYAIGNPLGEYPYSVTQGIISAKNRVREFNITGKFGFLQSSATAIWGNSGGPLIDTSGKVVGINSQIGFAKNSEQQSIWQPQINFALENIIAKRLIAEIIDYGYVKRGYLGIELGQKYFLSESRKSSDETVILYNVIPESPAASILKNKTGSGLIKINGVNIRNLQEALGELEKIKPGREVSLTFLQKEKEETLILKAEELGKSQLLEQLNQFIQTKANITTGAEALMVSLTAKTSGSNVSNMVGEKKQKLVAAGIYSTREPKNSYLWTVKSSADLAAVLRITGQFGYVDLLLFDSITKKVSPQKLVISYEKGTYNKTIWY